MSFLYYQKRGYQEYEPFFLNDFEFACRKLMSTLISSTTDESFCYTILRRKMMQSFVNFGHYKGQQIYLRYQIRCEYKNEYAAKILLILDVDEVWSWSQQDGKEWNASTSLLGDGRVFRLLHVETRWASRFVFSYHHQPGYMRSNTTYFSQIQAWSFTQFTHTRLTISYYHAFKEKKW